MADRNWTAGFRTVLVCLCLLMSGLLRADEWAPPHLEHWSSNHQVVLRANEDKKTLTLLRVTSGGETRLWSVPSPMEGPFSLPSIVYIRDDGQSVVLQDSYANLGYGKVLVFLGGQGQLLHAYRLEDLFSKSEILDVQHTVSSIWWSTPGLFHFTEKGDRFGFLTHWGSFGLFDVTTGLKLPSSGLETDAFRDEARKVEQKDLQGGGEITRGVMLAGLLKDRTSVPTLKQLLTDPSHCQMISTGRQDNYYGLQLDAGKALVRILGKEAAPLLEKRLAGANSSMAEAWIELIQETGMAAQSEAILRYTQVRDRYVRFYAIKAIAESGGIAVVRHHPAWFGDAYENIRYSTVRCLAEQGDTRDLPMLRRAFQDPDETVVLWALRGLIRLKPVELRTLLHRHLNVSEARIALADGGDSEQLHWCLTQLHRFASPKAATSISRSDIQEIAKVLVRRRPQGTETALHEVAKIPGSHYTSATYYPSIGLGGPAALGDQAALAKERSLAATAEMFSATQAIEWLGIAQDRASLPLLRTLLTNREVLIRDAARDALKTMHAPEAEPPPAQHASLPAILHTPSHARNLRPTALTIAGILVLLLTTLRIAARNTKRVL